MMRFKRWSRMIRFGALAAALLMGAGAVGLGARRASAHDEVLRLHIVANSDEARDQRVKLLVRDSVLRLLPACGSAAETEAYLRKHGRELLACAEQTLAENGLAYGAQLHLGKSVFPERTYRDVTYPAGEYEALRIVLGSGGGQNWWCVLFPPLCIITAEQQPLPEIGQVEFESSVLNWIRSLEDEQ